MASTCLGVERAPVDVADTRSSGAAARAGVPDLVASAAEAGSCASVDAGGLGCGSGSSQRAAWAPAREGPASKVLCSFCKDCTYLLCTCLGGPPSGAAVATGSGAAAAASAGRAPRSAATLASAGASLRGGGLGGAAAWLCTALIGPSTGGEAGGSSASPTSARAVRIAHASARGGEGDGTTS